MLRFVIYVHLYHVFLNISDLLEMVSMHKHCSNHFCILGFKMSIVVLIKKSCKLCSKTVFDPNLYSHKTKMMFYTYSNRNESHVPISFYTTLHFLTFDFDFCLTFSWIFFCILTCLHVFWVPLNIFDQFCDIKYIFRICAHVVWEYALNVWNLQFPKVDVIV